MAAIIRFAISSLVAIFAIVGVMPTAHGRASAAGISTDRQQYRPGDSITICYTVPGPGPITITDYSSDGSSAVLANWYDDGTGWCFTAVAQGPASSERLVLSWATGSDSGSVETNYEVIDAAGDVVLTLADANSTVTVSVGQRIRVELGIGLNWHLASSDAAILRAEPGAPSGSQGFWRAVAPGQATISGRGDPFCYPQCLAPSRIFSVTLIVV